MHSTNNFSFSFLNCGLIISIFSCSIYFRSGCLLISISFSLFLFSIAIFLLIFLFSIAVSYFLFLFLFWIAVFLFLYFFSELRSFYFTSASAQPEKLTVRDTLDECPKKKTLQKTKKNWKSFILFPQISLLLRLVNHNWHLIMMSRWQTS